MSQPPYKRRRATVADDVLWSIDINTCSAFERYTKVLSELLNNCLFTLRNTEDFTGLVVEEMDDCNTCYISAKIGCSAHIKDGVCGGSDSLQFCISLDMLKKVLKQIDSGEVMRIVSYADREGRISIHSHNREDQHSGMTSELTTVNYEDREPADVDRLKFDHVIEMELAQLKSLLKTALDLSAGAIEFIIEAPTMTDAQGQVSILPPDENGLIHNIFSIAIEGDGVNTVKTFHSVTKLEESDQVMVLRAQSADAPSIVFDRSQTEETFRSAFAPKYLASVLKHLEHGQIKLFMGNGLPMLMEYGLGSDSSFIKVLIAPKCDE
ncbi:MAG: hypothetical protein K0U52_07405 [Gammaproteobacteria bacterium]|nr:hypothetical protein [Gammaproteobacteria bacterium]